jgi:hypothetical protein
VSDAPKIPFPFAFHPRAIDRALVDRRIDRDGHAILVALYARVDLDTWVVSITLDTLASALAWPHSTDWLRKKLNGLRGCWIDYRTRPGVKAPVYVIRLLHGCSDESEHRLSTDGDTSPSTATREGGSGSGVAAGGPADPSEHETAPAAQTGPREPASRLSTDGAASPLAEPDRGPSPPTPVRARLDLPREDHTVTEEGLKENGLGPSSVDHLVGEGRRAVGARSLDARCGDQERLFEVEAERRWRPWD